MAPPNRLYGLGKVGSAFTSWICLVWRSLCAANKPESARTRRASFPWDYRWHALSKSSWAFTKPSVCARVSVKCLSDPSGEPKAVSGLERRCLDFIPAVWHSRQNRLVESLHIIASGPRGRFIT
jgi:hypothetical protein